MKRLFAILICVLALACLFAAHAWADGDVISYYVWLGDTQVTSLNKDDILHDGGRAKFDPDTDTLTLNEPVITGSHENSVIYSYNWYLDLTIKGSYHQTEAQSDIGLFLEAHNTTLDGDFTFRGNTYGIYAPDSNINMQSGRLGAFGTCGIYCRGFSAGPEVTLIEAAGTQSCDVALYAYSYCAFDEALGVASPVGGSFSHCYFREKDGTAAGRLVIQKTSQIPDPGEPEEPPTVTEYDLWLGETRVTAANRNDILGDGGKAKYDPAVRTLTLNDPAIRGVHTDAQARQSKICSSVIGLRVEGSYHMSGAEAAYGFLGDGGSADFRGRFSFLGSADGIRGSRVSVSAGNLSSQGGSGFGLTANYVYFGNGAVRIELKGGSAGLHYDIAGDKESELSVESPELGFFNDSSVYSFVNGEYTIARDLVIANNYNYPLWLGYTQVTGRNKHDILGDGSASFDPETNTLMLNEPMIVTNPDDTNSAKIKTDLEGTLNIRGSYHMTEADAACGVYAGYFNPWLVTFDGDFSFIGLASGIFGNDMEVKSGSLKAVGLGQCEGKSGEGIHCWSLAIDEAVSRVELEGAECALYAIGSGLIPRGLIGFCLPQGGEYSPVTYSVMEADGTTVAKKAVFEPGYPVSYNLWVGSTRVTNQNKDDVLGDGGRVSFDPDTGTLMLNEPVINTCFTFDGTHSAAIFAREMLNLSIAGSWHMDEATAEYGVVLYRGRISGVCNLKLDGDMTLKGAQAGVYCGSQAGSVSVHVSGTYNTVTLGGNIAAYGGQSSGVECEGAVTVTGNAVLQGGRNGLHASDLVTLDGEDLTFTGGICGIQVSYAGLRIKGGNVIAFGDKTAGILSAEKIESKPDSSVFEILGGVIKATSTDGIGLWSDQLPVFIGDAVDKLEMEGGMRAMRAPDLVFDDLSDRNMTIIEPEKCVFVKARRGFYTNPEGNTYISSKRVVLSASYKLWLGSKTVGPYNQDDIFGDGKARYDPKTNTLTLHDPVINGDHSLPSESGMVRAKILTSREDLTIVGSYHMTEAETIFGVCTLDASLTLDGSFSFAGTQVGIYAGRDLTLNGVISAQGGDTAGILSVGGDVDITGGRISAGGGLCGLVCANGRTLTISTATEKLVFEGENKAAVMAGALRYDIVDGAGLKITAPADCYFSMSNGNGTFLAPPDYSGSGPVIVTTSDDPVVAKRVVIEKETAYQLWVGETRVGLSNRDDILGDGSARYDNDTHTLTLSNPTIRTAMEGSLIYARGMDLTVKGTAVLSGETENAVRVDRGDLTLDGDLTLTAAVCAVRAVHVAKGENIQIVTPERGWITYIEAQDGTYFGTVCAEDTQIPAASVRTQYQVLYPLWLGSTQVNHLNYNDIFGDGRASFDLETHVLTLNDPTIPGSTEVGLTQPSKIRSRGYDLTIRGSYTMPQGDSAIGLDVKDGALFLDGSFSFNASDTGIWVDHHMTVRGTLTAVGTGYAGIYLDVDETAHPDEGLELLPGYTVDTTVDMQGKNYALMNRGVTLEPVNGLSLLEPADGWIDVYSRGIYESAGTYAKHAILQLGCTMHGEGTAENPCLIFGTEEWDKLAREIENGLDTSGMYFNLLSNISVSTMLGTAYNPFRGTFDGYAGPTFGSRTLTLDLPDGGYAAAPFRYISGATIRNLITEGSVSGFDSAGLVGAVAGDGNLIENCEVRAEVITYSTCAGGIVGNGGSFSTTLRDCAFSGVVTGLSQNGGVMFWQLASLWGGSTESAAVTLENCLDLSGHDWPIGRGGGSITLTNVYYTADRQPIGDNGAWTEGEKRAWTVDARNAEVNLDGPVGMTYGGTIYAAEGESLSLTATPADVEYTVNAGTLTQNGGALTLLMPANHVTIFRNTDVTYAINRAPTEHGYFTASRIRTFVGDRVSMIIKPDNGYMLDALTVIGPDDSAVETSVDEDGHPCFTMPGGEVTVSVSFKKKYSFNSETGELRLLYGAFGNFYDQPWADGDFAKLSVKRVTAADGVRFVDNCSFLFLNFMNCESFQLGNVDTSGMTDAGHMFENCAALQTLDLSGWDVSRLADTQSMFEGCAALSALDLSGWETSPLSDAAGMFKNCGSLTALDFTGLSLSGETAVEGMLENAGALREINLAPEMGVTEAMRLNNNGSGWIADGTTRVLCYGADYGSFTAPAEATAWRWATEVLGPRYSFDSATGALTLRWGIFNANENWGSDVNCFAVASVKAQEGTCFSGDCNSLFMNFSGCGSMDLSKVNTLGMTDISGMFQNCESLTTLDISGWDTSGVMNMSQTFASCCALEALNVWSWNTSAVTDMSGMFSGCAGLTALDLSRFVTGNVKNMSLMFEDCSGLTALDLSSFETDQVLWMDGMFADCTVLEELNLSGFTIAPWVETEDGGDEEFSGTSVADMFARDRSLHRLTLSPNMGVTEEMRLNNGNEYAGWIVSGDADCAVISGDGEYAVIAAPKAVTDYSWNPGRETVPLFTAADAALLLPAALTEIGEEAFAESPAVSIYLQDQVASIGERAFAGCTALRAIRIPSSVTEIADSAFDGCGSDLVIYGAEDSEALTFAWENGFLFASEESGTVLRPGL